MQLTNNIQYILDTVRGSEMVEVQVQQKNRVILFSCSVLSDMFYEKCWFPAKYSASLFWVFGRSQLLLLLACWPAEK